MVDISVSTELRAVIAELARVRRAIMADEPRRTTFQWVERAKRNAEILLARVEEAQGITAIAAE